MNIQADFILMEAYFPDKRYKKPKYRRVNKSTEIAVAETEGIYAPIVSNNILNRFGEAVECRLYDGRLWTAAMHKFSNASGRRPLLLNDFISIIESKRRHNFHDSEREVLDILNKYVSKYLIIDGAVFIEVQEASELKYEGCEYGPIFSSKIDNSVIKESLNKMFALI